MGKPIATPDEAAKKWKKNAAGAESEYVEQVQKSTWKTEAKAGEENYGKAMRNVVDKKLREKGIDNASDEKWRDGVESKKNRFSEGVDKGEEDMKNGITDVINDIKAEVPQLKSRGPKGSAENFERSKQLGMKLHDAAMKRKEG